MIRVDTAIEACEALFMHNAATKSEVLAIIDTLEGMLRTKWCEYLLAERTKWCAVLAGLEGR